MKARIEITTAEHVRAGSPLTQRCADAARVLLAGGGHGKSWREPSSDIYVYTFDGPDDLVRDVVTAMMDFKLTVPTPDPDVPIR